MNELTLIGFKAHAKSDTFKRRLEHAFDIIERAKSSRPYIAFSGGKDSLVALAIAAQILPNPRALWNDNELEYDENLTYIPDTCKKLGVELMIKTGSSVHADWFTPWVDSPFWREPLPGTIITKAKTGEVAKEHGYYGCILGLRREESIKRAWYLSKKHEIYEVSYGITLVHPLAGWTIQDIWALIIDWDLPINPVYNKLDSLGVPLKLQRVGPLPLTNGGDLRAGWPEMYARLQNRYGNKWG